MSRIQVKSQKVIAGKPDEVYSILADYEEKRPQILPENFQEYSVERGGQGSGTVVNYLLHAARRVRPYRMRIAEPVKGQMLTESDSNSSLVTRWLVTPVENGSRSLVSVISDWEGSSGIRGFFERIFASIGLRQIYRHILIALEKMVKEPEEEVAKRPSVGGIVLKAGGFALVLSSVVAVSFLISYLRNRSGGESI